MTSARLEEISYRFLAIRDWWNWMTPRLAVVPSPLPQGRIATIARCSADMNAPYQSQALIAIYQAINGGR